MSCRSHRMDWLTAVVLALGILVLSGSCSSGGPGAPGGGPATHDPANPSPEDPANPSSENTPDNAQQTSDRWTLTTTATDWDVAYDGYGTVTFDAASGIVLQPKAAGLPSETHAALVLAKRGEQTPFGDAKITVVVTTETQLRASAPNAWECFWLFFNYTLGDNGKKVTNYFILKPNGVELGTAYDEAGQTFLATGESPTLHIGAPNEIIVTKRGQTLEVVIDGQPAMTYDGTSVAKPLIDVAGTVGLYSEDARVRIHSISIEPL